MVQDSTANGMFYFVYILRSKKDDKLYIGFTIDVKKRLAKHNAGEVESTKDRRPLNLVYYEAFINKIDALKREKYFKTTKGEKLLRLILKNYFISQ